MTGCQSFFFGALVKVEAAFENYKNLDPAFKKTFTTALREAAGAVNVVEFEVVDLHLEVVIDIDLVMVDLVIDDAVVVYLCLAVVVVHLSVVDL